MTLLSVEHFPCLLEALGLERTSYAKQITTTTKKKADTHTQTQKTSSFMDSELTRIKSEYILYVIV